MKNYGFDPDKLVIEEEEYKLGALPFEVIAPDGQWEPPVYEPQAEKYETFGCTVWGTLNAIEMYFKKVFGFEPNYNEVFTYILAGITLDGASPQKACEAIRKNGVVDNALIPFPATYEEFSDPKQITPTLKAKGIEWLSDYDFKHEWIMSPTQDDIKEMLKYSPIGVGVTAWFKDENGLYVSRGLKNTHWCCAFGTTEEGNIKIFDSYDSSVKVLHPSHQISVGKRYVIKKIEKELPLLVPVKKNDLWFVSIGRSLKEFLKLAWRFITNL